MINRSGLLFSSSHTRAALWYCFKTVLLRSVRQQRSGYATGRPLWTWWSSTESGCCLLAEWGCAAEGGGVCLSVDRQCVESGGSLGADQSEHCMAYESHAPSAAVQFSQKELLRNVTAIRDGAAQTPAATASLRRPEPRNNLLLEYKQDFSFQFISTLSSSSPPPVETSCMRHLFTCHSSRGWLIKKAPYIHTCGSSCWLHTLVSFGMCFLIWLHT